MNAAGIDVVDLCFRIGRFEMDGLTLRVDPGEYFVLTGHNGAGKSLLIKLIAGLYRPLGGTIRINGRDLQDLPPWKRNLGYVPQEGILFPNRDVRGNILFGLQMRRLSGTEQQDRLGEVTALLGIDGLLDRDVEGLSGGERQKVGLARALVLEPDVLLLDEPVSAIDEETRDSLCRDLRTIQERIGVTVVHVSHNRNETALVADRVGVLENGVLAGVCDVERSPEGRATPPPVGWTVALSGKAPAEVTGEHR